MTGTTTVPPLEGKLLEEAISLIAGARSLVVSTGAGMSSDNGIRTFRGADGWWRDRRAEDLATLEAIRREPDVVWEWYADRLLASEDLQPHRGYTALAEFQAYRGGFPVITQNVDGLHQKAGLEDVIELHGSLRTASCLEGCGAPPVELTPDLLENIPPMCSCGSVLRPDVVLFGESLPAAALNRAFLVAKRCDVMLLIGTSLAVYPASALPVVAIEAGARVVEINPDETPMAMLPRVITLRGGASSVLPAVLNGVAR